MVVTFVSLFALTLMAALALRKAMPGMHQAYQNAAWQEARVAAEAGIDSAIHDLQLNATGFAPAAWTGWKEQEVDGKPPTKGLLGSLLNETQKPLQLVNNLIAQLVWQRGK